MFLHNNSKQDTKEASCRLEALFSANEITYKEAYIVDCQAIKHKTKKPIPQVRLTLLKYQTIL